MTARGSTLEFNSGNNLKILSRHMLGIVVDGFHGCLGTGNESTKFAGRCM
eukprot:c38204_g1_i1 orf=20-169(-)